MMNLYMRSCFLYGTGAVSSALTVFVFWILGKILSGWGFLLRDLNIDNFYGPMFWGGVCRLGLLLPPKYGRTIQFMLCAIFAALLHIFMIHNWLNVRFFSLFNSTALLQKTELCLILTYIVVWGGMFALISRKG